MKSERSDSSSKNYLISRNSAEKDKTIFYQQYKKRTRFILQPWEELYYLLRDDENAEATQTAPSDIIFTTDDIDKIVLNYKDLLLQRRFDQTFLQWLVSTHQFDAASRLVELCSDKNIFHDAKDKKSIFYEAAEEYYLLRPSEKQRECVSFIKKLLSWEKLPIITKDEADLSVIDYIIFSSNFKHVFDLFEELLKWEEMSDYNKLIIIMRAFNIEKTKKSPFTADYLIGALVKYVKCSNICNANVPSNFSPHIFINLQSIPHIKAFMDRFTLKEEGLTNLDYTRNNAMEWFWFVVNQSGKKCIEKMKTVLQDEHEYLAIIGMLEQYSIHLQVMSGNKNFSVDEALKYVNLGANLHFVDFGENPTFINNLFDYKTCDEIKKFESFAVAWNSFDKNKGEYPVHKAFYNKDINLFDFLLSKGADLNVTTEEGENLVHIAIDSDFMEGLIRLKEIGALSMNPDRYYDAPLHLACENGDIKFVKFLLENGADVNAQNSIGNTPLMSCVGSKNFSEEIFSLLMLQNNIDIFKSNNGDENIIHKLVHHKKTDMIKYFKDTTALKKVIYNMNRQNQTPFHLAIYLGDMQSFESLINYTIHFLNFKKIEQHRYLLDVAYNRGYSQILMGLVNMGFRSENGRNALQLCSVGTQNKLFDFTLFSWVFNKHNINETDKNGYSVLFYSLQHILNTREKFTKFHNEANSRFIRLLKAGANPNTISNDGSTIFHYIAINFPDNVACYLVKMIILHSNKNLFEIYSEDTNNKNCLDYAAMTGKHELFEILKHINDLAFIINYKSSVELESFLSNIPENERGFVVNKKSGVLEFSPLISLIQHSCKYYAENYQIKDCTKERDELFKKIDILIKYGANINQQDVDGNTALTYAALYSDELVIRELLQYQADVTIPNTAGRIPLHLIGYYRKDLEQQFDRNIVLILKGAERLSFREDINDNKKSSFQYFVP